MEEHVRESIKEVDENTWLIGGLILHRSKGISHLSTWYDRNDDLSYIVTDAPVPPPPAIPLAADNPTMKLVYEAEDSSAVWFLGNDAFCKVKLRVVDTTPEAVTLTFVHAQRPDLEIPRVLHYAEYNGRSYLFVSRVPGRTLADAWPTLNENWRHRYVNAVVGICESLQLLEGDKLGGVDGKNIPEKYLIEDGAVEDYCPQNLQRGCESMGMDCSKLVFYHADLGPGNIIVEDVPESGTVGIIDWETAGFFPKG